MLNTNKLIAVLVFIGTIILYSFSPLKTEHIFMPGDGTQGGLLGASFLGLILVLMPEFFKFRSSSVDSKTTPALAFTFLGWVILTASFGVSLIFWLYK